MFVDLLNTLQTSTQELPARALEVTSTSIDGNLTPASAFAVNLQSQLENSAPAPVAVADAVENLLIAQAAETAGRTSPAVGNDLPVQGRSLPVSAIALSRGESAVTADGHAVQEQASMYPAGQPQHADTIPRSGVRPDASARPLTVPEVDTGPSLVAQSTADGQLRADRQLTANGQSTVRPSGAPTEGAEESLPDVESSTAVAEPADGSDQRLERGFVPTDAQMTPAQMPHSMALHPQHQVASAEPGATVVRGSVPQPPAPSMTADHEPDEPLSRPAREVIRSKPYIRDDKAAPSADLQTVPVAEKKVWPEPFKVDSKPAGTIATPAHKSPDLQSAASMPRTEAPLHKSLSSQAQPSSEQLTVRNADPLESGMMSGARLPRVQVDPGVARASVTAQDTVKHELVSRDLDGLVRSVENHERLVRSAAADISSAKRDVLPAIEPVRGEQPMTQMSGRPAQAAPIDAATVHVERVHNQGSAVVQPWRRSAGPDERSTLHKALQRAADGSSVRTESISSVADARPVERPLAEALFVQPARPTTVATDVLSGNSSVPVPTSHDAALSAREQLAQSVQAQITRAMTRQALMQGRISVQLNPVELGAVDLDIATERGEIQIVMVAREVATRDLLDAGLMRLRHALQEAGLAVSALDVRHDNADAQRRDARQAFDGDGQRRKSATLRRNSVDMDPASSVRGADRADGFYAYA